MATAAAKAGPRLRRRPERAVPKRIGCGLRACRRAGTRPTVRTMSCLRKVSAAPPGVGQARIGRQAPAGVGQPLTGGVERQDRSQELTARSRWMLGLAVCALALVSVALQPAVAQQNPEGADKEARVLMNATGGRTVYQHDRGARTLEATTFDDAENDVVTLREFYELDQYGNELRCLIKDAANELRLTRLYRYDGLGRRSEEGTYNAQGQLLRVVAFPFEDGQRRKPVVVRWTYTDPAWAGVLWMMDPADPSGRRARPVPNQALTENQLAKLAGDGIDLADLQVADAEAAQPTAQEIATAVTNEAVAPGKEKTTEEIIQVIHNRHDPTRADLDAAALLQAEEWARESRGAGGAAGN